MRCTGLQRHTVIAAVRRLEAGGYLTHRTQPGVRAEYELHLDRCLNCTGAKEVPVSVLHQTGANGIPLLVQKGYTTVPNTVPLSVHGRARALPADFETFWKAYPRKVGKRAALAVWKTLNGTRPTVEALVASVKAHAESEEWRADGGRFIPYPVTFLRQGRWEDELDATPGGAVKRRAPSADDLEALRLAREDDSEVTR